MKRFLTAAALAAPVLLAAQKLPQPSPSGKVEQIVGLTTVKVDYSRPSARGRVVFGDLVPYGEVWRTGANKCTTIEFDGPVMVEEQPVKPGKYSLFTIPSEDTWVVILNSNTDLWGASDRKPEEDILTVKVPMSKVEPAVETFTIDFDEIKDDAALLTLAWEHFRIGVRIHADATKQALANIQEALAKPDAKFNAYHSSARFCIDRGLQLKDALTWAQKSVTMEKKYWNTYTLALAYAAVDDKRQAIMTAEESMKLAQDAKDEQYVKMCRERIEEWSK